MKQEIVIDKPPIFDEILKVFPDAAQPGVLFSWGTRIYNPSGFPIPPQLIAHEAVHGERQLRIYPASERADVGEAGDELSIRYWWADYLKDEKFRLEEELLAHRAEYQSYCSFVKDREQRARYLHRVAIRLAGKLYNNLLTYREASKAISK